VNQYITKVLHSNVITAFQNIFLPTCFETGKNYLSVLFIRIISICFLFFIFFARPVSAAATNAYNFDGGDYASMSNIVADLNGQSAMTISLWAKFTDTSAAHCLFGHTGGKLYFCFDGDGTIGAPGKLIAGQNSGADANISTNTVTLNDNTWYHLVVVYSASDWTIYVNGASEPLDKRPFAGTLNGLGSGDFYVGYSSSLGNKFFDGVMDDFQVYNTALDQTAVTSLYAAGSPTEIPANTTGLITYWKMNGTATTGAASVIDSETAGNNTGQLGANTTSEANDPTTGATGIVSAADAIAPTISAVSITDSVHKVGDTVTATITVTSDADDYTTGSGAITGTINGYTLGSLSKTNNTTYTATFSITDGGSDVAEGSTIAVNFTLDDSAGNTSSAYSTAISQSSDAIYANLPEVNLSANTNTIAEDGGVSILTATLSGSLNNQWPAGITVNLAYTGTGTAGTDYTKSDSIVISSGNSSNTSTLTGTADTVFDAAAAETAIVDISSVSVGNEGTTNQQTITITDAETAPTVTLSVGNTSIAENGGTSSITATLSHETYDNAVVNFSYSGTATGGGTDYNTPSSSITINAGSLTANTVTGITAVDDGSSDGNLTIVIDISSVTGSASENGTQQKTVTIIEDDNTAPALTNLLTAYTVIEDIASAINLSAATFSDTEGDSLTVTLAVNGGTIASIDGNVVTSNVTITNSGTSSMTIAGSIADIHTYLDTVNKIEVTTATNSLTDITLTLTPNDGELSGASVTSTLSVTPVNDAPTVSIGANQTVGGVGMGGVTQTVNTFASSFNDGDDGTQAISNFIISEANDVNNVVSAVDIDNAGHLTYTPASNLEGVATINVQVQDDGSTANSGVDTSPIQTFTITVDTVAPVISAIVIPNSPHKVGDVVTATITVGTDTDTYTLGNSTVGGYTLASFSKTNDTTYTATFTITDGGVDVDAGADIPVSLILTDASGNSNAAFTTAISQVSDAIYANLPDFTLSAADGTLSESGDTEIITASITGSLNNKWPVNLSVPLSFDDTNNSGINNDYSVSGSSITITAGLSSGFITATGIDDAIFDAPSNESFVVSIGSLSIGNDNGGDPTIIITDDELTPVVTLQVSDNTINEDGGMASITATLNNATYANVTVDLSYTGTATSAGTDYNSPSANITIIGGATSGDAVTGITSVNDNVEEGDEAIIIDVSTISDGSATENGAQQQTITITDDDDTTPPVFESGTPVLSNINVAGATLAVDIDEQGDVYYIVVDQGVTAPTAVQTKAPINYTGATVHASGTITTINTTGTANIVGLSDAIDYTVYVVAQDTNANLQANASVEALTLTTDDILPNITSITLSGPTAATAPNITYNVVFSDDVINVDITDFTLTLVNGATHVVPVINTLSAVGGSGTSYTVTITTGVTVGDIRLDLNAGTDIVDESSNTTPDGYTGGDVHSVDTNLSPTIIEQPNPIGIFTIDEDVKTSLDLSDVFTADDNGDEITVTLSSDNGLLFATDGNGTVSSTTIAGSSVTGTSSITLTGLGNDINTFLDDVTRILFQTTLNNTDVSTLTITSDDWFEAGTGLSKTITINAINDAPTISGVPATSVVDGNAYSFTPTASDIENDTLGFAITNPPTWASFDTATGELSGNPTPAHVGTTTGIVIRVEDSNGAGNDLAAFNVEVTASNAAPVITQGTNTTVVMSEDGSPTAFLLTLGATDANSDPLTWSISSQATNGSATVSGTGNSKAVSYTPTNHYFGADSFVVNVSDGLVNDTITVNVTVSSVNDLPNFTSTGVTAATQDSNYNYNIIASDSDDSTLAITATTKPTWLTVADNGNGTATLSGLPTNANVGNNSVVLSVVDNENAAAIQSFTVVVSNTNDAPVITGTPAITVAQDVVYSFTPSVSDADTGDTQTFSITNKPDWAAFSTTTGVLTGTPTNDDVGVTAGIVITATDSAGATASLTAFSVTVSNTNDAPVISGTPATTVAQDEAYSFTPSVSDADAGDTQTFSITNKPNWAEFSAITGALTGTPTNDDVGVTAGIVITATDSAGATASLTAFSVTVSNTNEAPVITGTPTITVAQDVVYSFTPSVADVDAGDTHTFSITNKPSWAAFIATTGALTGTPTNDDVGVTAGIVITATDSAGATASLTAFSVTVSNTNDAPVITGTPAITAAQDEAYNFTPSVSDADAGDTSTFSITNKPNWATFSATTGALTGTPTNDDVGVTAGVVITATDSAGGAASLTPFNLEVIVINQAPVAADVSETLAEDSDTSVTLTATDNDEGDEFTFVIASEPLHGSLTASLDNTAQWQYTPEADYQGEDSFTYTANDGDADSAPATVTLTITSVNDAPVATDDDITLASNETGVYVIDVLSNDSDIENDELTITNASASIGRVSIDNNQLVYQTQAGVQGVISLEYVINDGHPTQDNGSAQARVTLFIDGGINVQLPIITLPEDVIVNATGLFTKVDLGVATAVDNAGQILPVSLVDGSTLFRPGNHVAYWQAEDSQGLKSVASQSVIVHPLITMSRDKTSVEGTSHDVFIYLNGAAPLYPVTIGYSVSGSADANDHNLISGDIVIDSGEVGSISFDVLADDMAEDSETLTITLDDTLNLGAGSAYTLTIAEQNIAPQVTYSVMQDNEQRLLIENNAGQVVIETEVSDSNTLDTHQYQWLDSDSELVDVDNDETTYTFDATGLTAGIQILSLVVTDNGDTPLSTTTNIYLVITEVLVVLTDVDSDGDLIPDNEEGLGDDDLDGIPNYLDVPSACNVMPQQASESQVFLVEGEAGVCLRKGSTVANNKSGGLELAPDEVLNDEDTLNVGGLFDFIAYGLSEAGQSYNLVLPQRLPIPAFALYRKLTPINGWVDFVVDVNNQVASSQGSFGFCPPPGDASWSIGLSEGHWCVQLTIEDGGPNDDDGLANGSIDDPGGVAVLISTNHFPVAEAETTSTAQNTPITIDVLGNDSDEDNDTLTINSASADFGVVDIAINIQQLIYTPPINFIGVATINYGVSDGNGGSSFANVTVTVIENQAPVAQNDSASTDDRTAIIIAPLANDSDGNDDTLTLISADAQQGSVTLGTDNTLTYTPKTGFDGEDIITYSIDDGKGGQATGQITVTVNAYKIITVTNTSSGGGAMAWWFIGIVSLLAYRRKMARVNSRAAPQQIPKDQGARS